MMMRRWAWLGVTVVGTMLLAACSGPGPDRATADLNNRLQTRLAQNIAAGRASVQPLPDGARVTLAAPSADGHWGVGQEQDARISTVQALLNPSLMQVEVASQTAPDAAMVQALEVLNWGAVTRTDVGAPASGMVVTVHVVCPEDEPIDGRPGCR